MPQVESSVHTTSRADAKASLGNKALLFIAPSAVMSIAQLACSLSGGVDPFAEPPLDPMAQTAQANAARNQQYQMEMTQTAQAPKVVPTAQATQTPFVFAADHVVCAPVVDDPNVANDGTVSEAVIRANHGEMPPYLFNGQEMHVSIDHNGARTINVLEDVMNGNGDKVMTYPAVGDNVCVAVNAFALQNQPSPTPKP